MDDAIALLFSQLPRRGLGPGRQRPRTGLVGLDDEQRVRGGETVELGADGRPFARKLGIGRIEPEQVEAFYQANRERLQRMQNQSTNTLVEREQGLALARLALVDEMQAQARQSVRKRLREGAKVELAD